MMLDLITASPGGGVFAVKMDVHDPAAMSGHMIGLAKFWGAGSAGVTATDSAWLQNSQDGDDTSVGEDALPSQGPVDRLTAAQQYPWAIVCGVPRTFDAAAGGMGGRHAEQKLAVLNFNLRSYIREIGYNAIFVTPVSSAELATIAGLGALTQDGRFLARDGGNELVLGQVVITDLPLNASNSKQDGKAQAVT